jgi:aspartyl protease family protein
MTTVYATTLSDVTIGDIHLTEVRASINASPQPTGILLGMSALKRIEFTQQGTNLTLRQATR